MSALLNWWILRRLLSAGFGEGFFVAGDGLEDIVEAGALEDVADGGMGLGENDSDATTQPRPARETAKRNAGQ